MRGKKNLDGTDDQTASKGTGAKRKRVIRRKEDISSSNNMVNKTYSSSFSETQEEIPIISVDKDLQSLKTNPQANKYGYFLNINNKCKDGGSEVTHINHNNKEENLTSKFGDNNMMVYGNSLSNKNDLFKLKKIQINQSIGKQHITRNCKGTNASSSHSTIHHVNKNHLYYGSDEDALDTAGQECGQSRITSEENIINDSQDTNMVTSQFSDDDDSSSIGDEDKDRLQDLLEEILHSRQKAFFKSPTVIEVLQNLADEQLD